MFVNQRQAAAMLAEAGLSRRIARDVLRAGLAGRPVEVGNALLYEVERLAVLVARPVVPRVVVDARCSHGLLVIRTRLDVSTPREVQLATISTSCHGIGLWSEVGLRLRGERGGFPLVATVGGFVVLGADVTGTQWRDGRLTLVMEDPGSWFHGFDEARILTRQGGRAWSMHDPWDNRIVEAA